MTSSEASSLHLMLTSELIDFREFGFHLIVILNRLGDALERGCQPLLAVRELRTGQLGAFGLLWSKRPARHHHHLAGIPNRLLRLAEGSTCDFEQLMNATVLEIQRFLAVD